MLDNNNLIILLALIFICFFVISNRSRQQNDYYENNTHEPFDNKPKGIKFKATNAGYGKIVSVDDNGNLSSFEFPKGIIVAWSGDITKIPDGWNLCDGKNGTPDLRGRFIIGANPNSNRNSNFMINEMNATGGYEKALLSHTHTIGPQKSDYIVGGGGTDGYDNGRYYTGLGAGTMNPPQNTTENTLPPYYSLAYIMKL